jgi:hypothetical protein
MQMKFNFNKLVSITAYMLLTISYVYAQSDTVITYPIADKSLVSDEYAITVNGKPVRAYFAKTQWYEGGKYSFASFDFSGRITVTIKSKIDLSKVKILPEKYGITPHLYGEKELSFEADKPFQISIEPDGPSHGLLLFGNAPEKDKPKKGDPGVIYYGPGIYKPGIINLKSGQTLYLAGGAIVKGGIMAEGNNIRIMGRGILDGTDWGHGAGPLSRMINFVHCNNILMQGITVRGSWLWTIVPQACDGVTISNVKICGSRVGNDDGIDPVNSSNVLIKDCFIRTDDDCIAIKGLGLAHDKADSAITIQNCRLWTDYANIFRIGFESKESSMEDIHVKDVDVLHFTGDRSIKEYWNKCVFYIQPMDNLTMKDFTFEDIRINGEGEQNLIKIMPMHYSWDGTVRQTPGGGIKNLLFKNIDVYGSTPGNLGCIYVSGADEAHDVKSIVFENVIRYGNITTRYSPDVYIGNCAHNIHFTRTPGFHNDISSPKVLFVSKNGNDKNPGDTGHPLLTIKQAAGRATPGTIIIVGQGEYKGNAVLRSGGLSNNQRIIFRAAPRQKVVIRVGKYGFIRPLTTSLDYITIEGFTFSPSADSIFALINNYGGKHWIIQHCQFENTLGYGVAIQSGQSEEGNNEDLQGYNNDILIGNIFRNCYRGGIFGDKSIAGSQIRNNLIEDNAAALDGIELTHASNVLVENNCLRGTLASPIDTACVISGGSRNIRISSNTILYAKTAFELKNNGGAILADNNTLLHTNINAMHPVAGFFVHNLFDDCKFRVVPAIADEKEGHQTFWLNNIFIREGPELAPAVDSVNYNLYAEGAKINNGGADNAENNSLSHFSFSSADSGVTVAFSYSGTYNLSGPFITSKYLREFYPDAFRNQSVEIDLDSRGYTRGIGSQTPGPFVWLSKGSNKVILFDEALYEFK